MINNRLHCHPFQVLMVSPECRWSISYLHQESFLHGEKNKSRDAVKRMESAYNNSLIPKIRLSWRTISPLLNDFWWMKSVISRICRIRAYWKWCDIFCSWLRDIYTVKYFEPPIIEEDVSYFEAMTRGNDRSTTCYLIPLYSCHCCFQCFD